MIREMRDNYFVVPHRWGRIDPGCKRKRNVCSAVSRGVIVARATHSDLFPACSIALTAGLIRGASATKPNTEPGTNVRFLVTNVAGRSRSVFAFYNDRGECENRIEEFKNGFAPDRLSCHRFRANAFCLLLHSFAHNLVNLFRLQLRSSMRSAQIETLCIQLFKIGALIRFASFLDEGEIDEFMIYVIPKFIGEGIPLIAPDRRTRATKTDLLDEVPRRRSPAALYRP